MTTVAPAVLQSDLQAEDYNLQSQLEAAEREGRKRNRTMPSAVSQYKEHNPAKNAAQAVRTGLVAETNLAAVKMNGTKRGGSGDDSDHGENGEVQDHNVAMEESEDEDAVDEIDHDNEDTDKAQGDESSIQDDSDEEAGSEGSIAVDNWQDAAGSIASASAVEVATRNHCVYCGQDEEANPTGIEQEEYLACSVCGDNAHQQCARDHKSLKPDTELDKWRCSNCIDNALEPEPSETEKLRRLSSSSKLTRDLLPASRGASKPIQHSIFNTLILDDDPLDGSRSLRKRKASSEGLDVQSKASSKRRKRLSSADSHDDGASQTSPAVDAEPKVETTEHVEMSTPKPRSRASQSASQIRPPRPARPRRPNKKATEPSIRTIRKSSRSFVIAIRIDMSKIKIPTQKKKSRRPASSSMPHNHPRFAASSYSAPFYSLHDREADEAKSKPYGGILTETEADTSRTLPAPADRAKFEEARQKAEEEWKRKTALAEAELDQTKVGRGSQKVSGPPSKIKCINFGGYEIETWYAAPYPEEYSRNRVLYICEFCLKYMSSDYIAWRHKLKCPAKHPPGDEIYRDKSVSVFEVDGRKNPVYCQNLCLLAKLFLGSKTLYYDVEPFLFYIMTEYNELGCHFVGYFSKEKRPSSMNNVSCILTLPIHQRKGYGNFLIDFSYLLTRVEKKTGSPEKPLSDMGLVSYRNYWRLVLSHLLLEQKESLSITEISEKTGMTADDIVAALEALRALVRDPVTKKYALRLDHAYFRQCIESWEAKKYVRLDPDALIWTPYVMGRSNLATYDRAPPISTVAPREDDEETTAAAAAAAAVPEEGVQQQQVAQAAAEAAAAVAATGTAAPPAPTTKDAAPTALVNGVTEIKPAEDEELPAPGSTAIEDYQTVPDPPPLSAPLNTLPLHTNGTLPSHPATPLPSRSVNQAQPLSPSPIPPMRYELFPPVPGPSRPRRGGWRGGPRRTGTNTPATMPIRRSGKPIRGLDTPNTVAGSNVNGVGGGKGKEMEGSGQLTPSGRRTRSKAGGSAADLEGAEESAGLDEEERDGAQARAERTIVDENGMNVNFNGQIDRGVDVEDEDGEAEVEAVGDGADEEEEGEEEEEGDDEEIEEEMDEYQEVEDEDAESGEEGDEEVDIEEEEGEEEDDDDLPKSRARSMSRRARQLAAARAVKANKNRRSGLRKELQLGDEDEDEDDAEESEEEEGDDGSESGEEIGAEREDDEGEDNDNEESGDDDSDDDNHEEEGEGENEEEDDDDGEEEEEGGGGGAEDADADADADEDAEMEDA